MTIATEQVGIKLKIRICQFENMPAESRSSIPRQPPNQGQSAGVHQGRDSAGDFDLNRRRLCIANCSTSAAIDLYPSSSS